MNSQFLLILEQFQPLSKIFKKSFLLIPPVTLLWSITEPYTSAVQRQNGAGNEEKILIYQMSYQNHFCDSPI